MAMVECKGLTSIYNANTFFQLKVILIKQLNLQIFNITMHTTHNS